MKIVRRLVAVALSFGLVAVVVVGGLALTSEVQAASCRCPLVYAPVICDHGKTYPNPCVADCHHAQNCVPTGEL